MNRRWHYWLMMSPEGDGAVGGGGAAPAPATTAPKVTIRRAQAPAPAPAPKAPTPAPASTTPARPAKSDVATELAAMKKEREASARDRSLELARQRRTYVRTDLGLSAPLDDATLDRLLPDADPRTPEGRTALGKWKEGATWAFPRITEAPSAKPEDIVKRLPERQQKSVLFGADALNYAATQMRR